MVNMLKIIIYKNTYMSIHFQKQKRVIQNFKVKTHRKCSHSTNPIIHNALGKPRLINTTNHINS